MSGHSKLAATILSVYVRVLMEKGGDCRSEVRFEYRRSEKHLWCSIGKSLFKLAEKDFRFCYQ
ncbi:hypothetical protein FF011L_03510 [Roseimaritima multifibrata]|uniref:Uncharacterized protein n=1 Tax=Roseimaritima multifibrata TaxID=1930274 RepID=A0A517M9V3_9BACT|nr:hypothetical protein FF011L_03510 [Roseimaritima multifibrata]